VTDSQDDRGNPKNAGAFSRPGHGARWLVSNGGWAVGRRLRMTGGPVWWLIVIEDDQRGWWGAAGLWPLRAAAGVSGGC